jgi:hypothetical protein
MKPPRVLSISLSLWRLLIFGIIKASHYFQQWSLSSNFVKDKDLTQITQSGYDLSQTGEACGHSDSCLLRLKGFKQAGVQDTIRYRENKVSIELFC